MTCPSVDQLNPMHRSELERGPAIDPVAVTAPSIHPLATIFPLIEGAELAALVADISEHGLREPIVLHPDGSILDGRNRYAACLTAKVDPRFKTWDGVGSALAFVLSLNLRRRHLNESQRAMVAERIANLEHGGDRKSAIKSSIEPLVAREKAAGMLNVSVASMKRAGEVLEHGSAALVAAVERGQLRVSQAVRTIHRHKAAQDLAAAQIQVTEARRLQLASVCDLRVCSCADLFTSGIRPDAVITDPPYPAEFLPVFSELAIACASAHVLLVAVMSGQSYLPEVIRRLCEHLTYRWTMAFAMPGPNLRQFPAKVIVAWKPVLVFGVAEHWLLLTACLHYRRRSVGPPIGGTMALDLLVRITPNDRTNPPGKLADAELHFTDGPLSGLKLIGFAIWERRSGSGRNVTFPARQFSINGERRSFALLRPIIDIDAQNRVRELILEAFAEHEERQTTEAV